MTRAMTRMQRAAVVIGVVILAASTFPMVAAAGAAEPDPLGVLRKPIPDKLVVLTFDDSCASQATVVAPILKQLGFGGSFYICDFDSFSFRKDWYMTWRQMKALAAEGFEIGNHTRGHAGGSGIRPYLSMEDELLAHRLPKPTTIAWPMYQVNANTFADLAANGYTFGRGGHFRPYRPAADNPFDIPSFSVDSRTSAQRFVEYVRQAWDGRVVALTFHGVPDIEHPGCSVQPATFKVMMQYLKDNGYKVIALRDLAEYVDPAKAAKLPPTARDAKDATPSRLATEEKPITAVDIAPPPAAAAAGKPPSEQGRAGAESSPHPARTPQQADVVVDVAEHKEQSLPNPLAGTAVLVKTGPGRLRIASANTYAGGTIVDGGTLLLLAANDGLGTGPVTLNEGGKLHLEHVDGTNPLILNGGDLYAGNGFGDTWDGEITLNGNIPISSYADFMLNAKSGGIRGPGGLTHVGCPGGFGMANWGTISLAGTNTYTGPTVVLRGTLRILKAASLYNADASKWTPANIVVHTAATLVVRAGGEGELTGEQVDALLRNLTGKVDRSGLMDRAVFCIDTANAAGPVTVAADIADSRGPGGGPIVLHKRGKGVLRLIGRNTWTGQTVIEAGTLIVSSLNRVVGGSAASSLGAPKDIEAGQIVLGEGDGQAALVYTGAGETCDRAIDLAGQKSAVWLQQAGTGLLKLTGEIVISGFGTDKTVVLSGGPAGAGELASPLCDPYDRAGKARTSLIKAGDGTWTLSGENAYSGTTTVEAGTLAIAGPKALGPATAVKIEAGAKLELKFKGEAHASALTLDGKAQPAGRYDVSKTGGLIKGPGVLVVQ